MRGRIPFQHEHNKRDKKSFGKPRQQLFLLKSRHSLFADGFFFLFYHISAGIKCIVHQKHQTGICLHSLIQTSKTASDAALNG